AIGLPVIVYVDHEYSRVRRTGRTRKRDRQHALTVRRPSSMTLRRVSIRDRYISTSIGPGVSTCPVGGCCGVDKPGLSTARDGSAKDYTRQSPRYASSSTQITPGV